MHPQKHKPPGLASTKGLVAALLTLLVATLLMSLNAPASASPQVPLQALAQTSDDETGTPIVPAFDEVNITFILIKSPTPTRTPTPINVGNFVWDDIDKDGRQDAGEPGLSGVTVQLWNSTKTQLLGTKVTNASGIYTLVAPTPGNYRVRVLLPGGSDQFSPKDQAGGDDLLDSDINPSGTNFGFTDTYVFASNLISITSIDAGIIKYRTPTPTRTPTPVNVGNFVWDDLDGDGRQDAGEAGISGVQVQLWNSAKNDLIDTDVTNSNGNYTLVAPGPGNYRVRVLLPSPSLDQFSPKDQAGGDDLLDSDINPSGTNFGFTDTYVFASNLISITSIDAGIIKYRTPTPTRTPTPINLGNFVWNDLDSDGVQDGGEPGLANVTVQLWNSTKTQLLDSDSTNSNGNYTLVAPLPGDYRIRVLPLSGASFSPKDQGSDLTDSDINPSGTNSGFTDTISIASNVISITSLDAGMVNVPPTPTPDPTVGDTIALFGAAVNQFSLVDSQQLNPAPSNYLTFMSNAPIKGKFVMGDWDGNGQKTPGLFQDGKFWYTNQTSAAATWKKVNIGNFGAVNAVAGRFDAAFTNDCFGVVQFNNVPQNHDFRLHYTCELGQANPPSGIKKRWIDVTLPAPGAYQFVVGDWDGDGLDSIAVRRGKKIKWGNTAPSEGSATFTGTQNFGKPTESYGAVVAGDWNNNGIDTFGLFIKGNGKFYRRDDLGSTQAALKEQNLGKPVGNALADSWRKTGSFLSLDGLISVPAAPEANIVPVVTSTPPPPTTTPVPTYWPPSATATPSPTPSPTPTPQP